MGILNFFKIIISNEGSKFDNVELKTLCQKLKSLAELKNNPLITKQITVGIDASNVIYSSILAMKHVNTLSDKNGNTTSHIYTIFNKILMYNKLGFRQIWIFDSHIPNTLKSKTLKKRKEKKEKSDNEKVKFGMTAKHVDDIKRLLTLMGISYIISPPQIEAEQYGAFLTQNENPNNRLCQYMISNDSDVLMFGGNMLKCGYDKKPNSSTRTPYFYIYEISNILRCCNMKMEEFVKMGVVAGTDFNEKTPRVGIKTIMKRIKKNSIIMTEEQKIAYNYFTMDITNIIRKHPPIVSKYNEIGITEYLTSLEFTAEGNRGFIKKLNNYKPL